MKKLLCVFLSVLMTATLAACGGGASSEAKGSIKEFCEAMKDLDFEKMNSLVEYGGDLSEYSAYVENEAYEPLIKQLKKHTGKTKYKITSVDMDDDETGMVTVLFTYEDLSDVAVASLGTALGDSFTLALSGNSDAEGYMKAVANAFKEKYKEIGADKVKTEVIFHVEKVDDGWKIVQIPSETIPVLFCNMTGIFGSLAGNAADAAGNLTGNVLNGLKGLFK